MSDQVLIPVGRAGLAIPDYELLRPIGRGAYGEVWLARNVTGSWVALKIVHRSAFDHDRPFEREFEGIKRFEPISRSDPSQVAILHVGLGVGFFYYVMELADDVIAEGTSLKSKSETAQSLSPNLKVGRVTPCAPQLATDPPDGAHGVARPTNPATYQPKTLKRLLNDRGTLPAEECLAISLSLTSALTHLHGHGLVHRDVKPSNVIFVNGQAKLADIGLVTSVDATPSFVGTEGYLPPEGAGTPQADLYSLGKMLYEMATGCDRKEFPAPPPDVATRPDRDALAELNAIIVRACQLDPRQRYASAQELHDELALLQRGESVRRKRAGQRRWLVAKKLGLATLGLALLMTAVIFLKDSKHEHVPTPEAAQLYERGRWYYSQLTVEDHEKALKYLTQAVQMDPKFVQPYGELAALYTWCMLPDITNDQVRLQKTREIANKAMAIEPMSGEAHTALSWCRFLERDWLGAENEIVRAIKLNPNLAIARDIYSFYLTMLGRTDEARRQAQLAEEAEPSASKRATAIIGTWTFIADRRFDLAIAQLQRVLELDRNFAWGHLYVGECYEVQSNYVAALDELRAFDLLSGQDPAKIDPGYAAVRQAYESYGEVGYWQKRIELTLAQASLPEAQRIDSEIVNEPVAGYYARLGEKQKALDELEKHFDEPNVWHQIKFEPLYDSLHDEPRYKALVKRAGLEP